MGGCLWGNVETARCNVIPAAGKLSSLMVKLTAAPGAGKSYTFFLRVNGANSTLTVTIAGTDTSGSDISHEVTIAAGDLVAISQVGVSTPTAAAAIWTMKFEGDTACESLVLGSTADILNKVDTEYNFVSTGNSAMFGTESGRYNVIPTSGKLKNFYVGLNADPGDSPDAYKFTLRVNGANSDDGEGNPLQVTIVANNTTGNDTTHEIPVSPDDLVDIMIEPLEAPSATPIPYWSFCFVADIDGESLILNGDGDILSVAGTEYHHLGAVDLAWNASEAIRVQLAQECVMRKLYVYLTIAPGVSKSYVFTLRQNAGASALTVTIADAATTGNDTAHDVSISDGDEVSFENNPDGTPTASAAYWSLVCYIEPPKAQPGGGIVVDAVLAGLI